MRLQAVLFDLDDTLLGNDMDVFVARYLPMLVHHAKEHIEEERFTKELLAGTRSMIKNCDPGLTNRQVFWRHFSKATGLSKKQFQPVFDSFYENEFHRLKTLTYRKPEAREIVETCLAMQLKVVIATNPLFPLHAIEQRLDWAGVPVDEFNFALVTAYENMHAAKPNPAYFQEILREIGVEPDDAIMVGNDWENDILPADRSGLHTFWIHSSRNSPPEELKTLVGCGPLSEFGELLDDMLPS